MHNYDGAYITIIVGLIICLIYTLRQLKKQYRRGYEDGAKGLWDPEED